MSENGKIIGIVGSPNREGRTFQLITAAVSGASAAGSQTELIQLADYGVDACRDCIPWVCKDNLTCTFEDDAFTYLSKKILDCKALVLGTPVYWWDTSGMIKYLILKMFRVYARSAPLQGLPAFGISIAGGTGNGLISGLRPVYHFFQMMQMRALEPVPATRFNFDAALDRSTALGQQLAGMSDSRMPFQNLEERLLWYDALPYLGMSRAQERRLLADLTVQALPENAGASTIVGLARSDELVAAGKKLDALKEITRVYEAGVRAFEEQ